LALLKRARPDWEVHAMVAPGTLPLIEHDPDLDGVWTWQAGGDGCDARALAGDLRRAGFDAAVLLQYRRELALLLRGAGVRRLYGPRSKFSSWFLLNRGTRQGRSRSRRHEMALNADLVRGLLDGADVPVLPPRLYLSAAQREAGAAFRAEHAAGAETVAFVHPGSGGSALDWRPAGFAEVANTLAQQPGWRVFVTGAARDAATVGAVGARLRSEVNVLLDAFTLREFLGVLSAGDVFVGPSTGPLHMAPALGLAAVGLYPPVPTMAPARWGPQGRWVRALEPAVDCPAERICRGERCPLHNCMEEIAVAEVVAAAVTLAARRREERLADHRTGEE
jgi:ADP-heptose:LPS heptosyltransferase